MIRLNIFHFSTSLGRLIFFAGIFSCYALHRSGNSYFEKLYPPPVFFPKLDGKCAPKLKDCDQDSIFYSYDGSCNNLKYSYFGQALNPFERILPGHFSDGYDKPRISVDGSPLPSSRRIRTTVLLSGEYRSKEHNVLFYAFGQFNNHDTSQQKQIHVDKPCCENGKPIRPMPYECLPTMIPEDDEFYSQFGVTCVEVHRSTNSRYLKCPSTRPIRQMNFQTAFLDLSILYGPNEKRAHETRVMKRGLLKADEDSETSFQEYPFIKSGSDKCPRGGLTANPGDRCFYSGDNRINQNPEIFSLNGIFFRLHNFLARELHKINRPWDDELLYQMARRISIAMYQQVFGAEFVPAIIGSDAAELYQLYPATEGYIHGYDSDINPQTFHEYTAAVGRSSHSNVRGSFNLRGPDGRSNASYRLREKLFSLNFFLKKDVFLQIIEAYAFQQSNEQYKYFTEELTDFLFPQPDLSYGNDLSALDIDRGREFGLQSYNRYRAICGLRELQRFEDLADEIEDPMDVYKLKSLYHNVEDIDLYVAGILEKPYKDSTVGPTFTCLLGAQFNQWKLGDRLYFEFPTAKFTQSQLRTIRSTTFAQILCIAVPELEWVPKNAFYVETHWNPVIHCNSIERIDLSQWEEYY